MSQIVKMDMSAAKVQRDMEYEAGKDWMKRAERNKIRMSKIAALEEKICAYKKFVTEEDYNNCDYDFCMSYEEFID